MNETQHKLALPKGTRIGDFEFHRVLGHGGFGITYLGWNLALDIPVAIKEYLPADLATRESDLSVVPQSSQAMTDFQWGLDRFIDEARILARFQHPNIVRVHHFFQAHRTAYIVMEYAEGETLSAYLNRKGALTEAELKAILHPILDGLEVVHRADFLHRDIKPGNIIIRDEDDSPVLLDFGAARLAIGAKSRSVTSVVTPGYAPREQYSSRGNQGPWTDIYALGGVCYRALTAEVPTDAVDRMIDDPLIPVSERCKGRASHPFLAAIDHALQVDESARPQSASEWRAELGDAQEIARPPKTESPPPPVDDTAPKPKEHRKSRGKVLWAVLGMLALLAVASVVIYDYVEKQRREQEAEIARQKQAALEKQRREREISALLAGAKADLAAGRLTSPAGHNAWEKYQKVLELVPAHASATAGLDSILARYTLMFDAALKDKNFSSAEDYMDRIRTVHADAPVLDDLKRRLADAKAAHQEEMARQAEIARQKQAALEKQRREREAERPTLAREWNKFVAEMGHEPSLYGVSYEGMTDLYRASYLNLPTLTLYLLNKGADVNARVDNGSTPLHEAAYRNAHETAEVLLKHGADVNAKTDDGWTPLQVAAQENAHETAEVLLKHGANVNTKNKNGSTPLHMAAQENAHETAEVLLKHGAYVNAKDKNGLTPLHRAGYNNALETAALLLKHGADANAKNKNGSTPLHMAAQENAHETAALLRRYGGRE